MEALPDQVLRIDGRMPLDEQRRAAERLADLAAEPHGVQTHDEEIGGVACRLVVPVSSPRNEIVQYLHGGYAMCSLESHTRLAGHVALATGVTVVLVGYRRPPEHPFPAAVDDSVAVYRKLVTRGTSPAAIGIAGESAGGGITIATLVALRQDGVPLPAAAAVMSPWVDMTVTGHSVQTNAATDLFVSGDGLRTLAAHVLGDTDPHQPLASPLFADLGGLPDLLVQAASDEVLVDDARRLVSAARAAGVTVVEDYAAGMQHAFQLAAGRLDAADAALARLASFFAGRGIGDASASRSARHQEPAQAQPGTPTRET